MDEICPKCGDDLFDEGDKFECECGFKISSKLFSKIYCGRKGLSNEEFLSSL